MKPITILEGLALLFLVIAIILWLFYKVGENNAKRAKAFDELHDNIEDDIRSRPKNDYNCDVILAKLNKLEAMKMNQEKVDVLRTELNRKFECYK
jgi:hypothetical protein